MARQVPLLDLHELAAGKLAALLSRRAARDLFDAHRLLTGSSLDHEKLRVGFVLYGAMNRKDWRTVSPQDTDFDERELLNSLLPVLRFGYEPAGVSLRAWVQGLVAECQEALGVVLPLGDAEREFLDRLLDRGEVNASLLTADMDLMDRIERHPGIAWKALNARRFAGRGPV